MLPFPALLLCLFGGVFLLLPFCFGLQVLKKASEDSFRTPGPRLLPRVHFVLETLDLLGQLFLDCGRGGKSMSATSTTV